MKPLNASLRNGGTPMRFSKLFITAMIKVPNTVPVTVPLPPDILVPPTITAEMASIS